MQRGFFSDSWSDWRVLLALPGEEWRFCRLPGADVAVLVAVPVCYLLINSGFVPFWDWARPWLPRVLLR